MPRGGRSARHSALRLLCLAVAMGLMAGLAAALVAALAWSGAAASILWWAGGVVAPAFRY